MRKALLLAPLLGLSLIGPAFAEPSPALRADRDAAAPDRARAACAHDHFETFLASLASASPAAQRAFFGRRIDVKVQDRRGPGAPKPTARKVPGRSFTAFPLAMVNHHYVFARNGQPVADADGSPQFLSVTSERQTAILTDYPVSIVTVSWSKIRYTAPDPRRHEGEIAGEYGDSGRLIFAEGRKGCWELIDIHTTLQSDALRPAGVR